ncbi:DUF7002 family protein [Tateyamaria sp. SN6-1]|uniref:DUF7002 family protein n=1 Tax=Tateyamaria sp. SN6-1 TaxID=3092148 RepID=UPI0039F4B805
MSDAFARSVGGRLAHVTASTNVPHILRNGLMSAAALAENAGVDPSTLPLRATRLRVGDALLNHQKPIVHGLRAAEAVLEGHSPHSWAMQLDQRVFLWAARRVTRFAASFARSVETTVLWIDPVRLAAAMGPQIDLSPLNSGSFRQGAARAVRGDWLYVPLSDGLEAFRSNRIRRGHARTRDQVQEVSLRAPIPPEILREVMIND